MRRHTSHICNSTRKAHYLKHRPPVCKMGLTGTLDHSGCAPGGHGQESSCIYPVRPSEPAYYRSSVLPDHPDDPASVRPASVLTPFPPTQTKMISGSHE